MWRGEEENSKNQSTLGDGVKERGEELGERQTETENDSERKREAESRRGTKLKVKKKKSSENIQLMRWTLIPDAGCDVVVKQQCCDESLFSIGND